MFKIEKLTEGTITVLRLVGRISTEHLDELRTLIPDGEPSVKLDLSDVTLVDVDVIRFLGNQERRGVQLSNCSRYVREWIQREQTTSSTQPERRGVDAEEEDDVATKKITIERFSITSTKPFAEVVSAIDAQVGHPDLMQFYSSVQAAEDDEELQHLVNGAVGPTDLMEFMRLDQGIVLRRELGPEAPNVLRLLIGNPLIMRKMVKHVPDAGSYAPVTILIDERADGVHLSYDRMTSQIAPYPHSEALEVARALDRKVERLLLAASQ